MNQKGNTFRRDISESAGQHKGASLFSPGAPQSMINGSFPGTAVTVNFGLERLGGANPLSPQPQVEDLVPGVITGPKPLPRWKASLDAFFIFLASPLLLPLIVLIAVWIKLVSRGPVIFKQERVGYLGMPFTLFKFRTMKVDAKSESHCDHVRNLMNSDVPMTKMDCTGDSRLIPMGVWLRATGLDELPQLLNVLRGEMSLVGPRPCTFYEFEHYVPWQKERFNVAPGLTGLWQVSGKNKTTFTQMIRFDIEYARTVSLKKDLKIIFKTFSVLIGQFAEAVMVKCNRITADRNSGQATNGTMGLPRSANSGR